MDEKRILLVIRASDIPNLNIDEMDTESDSFKNIIYDHISENFGIIQVDIAIHVEDDTIAIEWLPKNDPG